DGVAEQSAAAPLAPRAAARALLLGRASLGRAALDPPAAGEDPVAHAVRLARGADGLVVAVQGPPGAGKSFLGAEVVDALLAGAGPGGVRIGVTANSHAVVQHLLRSIHSRSPAAVVRHKGAGASTAKDPDRWERLCEHPPCPEPALVTGHAAGWGAGEVLGGTAWAFAPETAPALDWLVVDEAGQMALADVLAAARHARNVLLLGDPQQLAKPSKAAHPAGVGVSALTHLMRGAATMPADRGIFLPSTRRMHADVAAFISDIAYDGRLAAHPVCADRAVLPLQPGADDPLSGTGLRHVPVVHEGNAQSSDEECAVVVALVRQLLRRRWTAAGEVADVTEADVLVVSPYTVAVRRLEAALARAGLGGVQVGTVDRFQGREAVAVVYATASSDADSAPRGLGFLYDTHRLNVAVSRARCLAFWVGSPQLLRPRVGAAHQVPLVDAHCRFVEHAVVVPPALLDGAATR
ncbi:MAG: Superfamily I DNA and RNA helicases and helicase subunits, partial [uncultured Quadrisphaera sp.]